MGISSSPRHMLPLLAVIVAALFVSIIPALAQSSAWPAPPPPRFASGMTDEELREAITSTWPELQQPDLSDEQRAIALRHWVHAFLPVSDNYNSLSNTEFDHNGKDLGRMLRAVEERVGGYYCGGHAEIGRKVYKLFGFETFTLNFGFRGTSSTHVTTFVRLKQNGNFIWSMQDPYLNFTLRTRDGQLMGYEELVRHLENDDIERVVIDDPGTPKTPALYTHPERVPRLNRRYHLQSECVREWDSFEEFLVRWDFRLMFTSMFDFDRQLNTRIGRSHPLYMFIVPIGFRGEKAQRHFFNDAKAAQARLLGKLGKTPEDLTKTIHLPPKPIDPI